MQQLCEGQLVGRMLLWRLATGATGVKQARYRRGPTLVSFPDPAPLRGKEGLGTLVDFLAFCAFQIM